MNTGITDLDDIQGNIVRAYGRFGYPHARYMFFQFHQVDAARDFLRSLLPYITTSRLWNDSVDFPAATTNIALTYQGLKQLGLPTQTLHSFPQEFTMGMKARAEILGDDGPSAPLNWDPIWQHDKRIHMFMSINAQSEDALRRRYETIDKLLEHTSAGVELLHGHRSSTGELLPYQEATALMHDGAPTSKEHFGFVDGISDPYFKGSGSHAFHLVGGGKPTRQSPKNPEGWEPLETGEFILGYRDETQEIPTAPIPNLLSHNGTFMVFRKLHQNVGSFNRYIEKLSQQFPDCPETLKAKMVGRWPNGAPLATFPTKASADAFIEQLEKMRELKNHLEDGPEKDRATERYMRLRQQMNGFHFNDDLAGTRCPMGAHIRRTNPRGCLEYGTGSFSTPGALDNRRRILRRGLPYGTVKDPYSDDGEHGIIFMALGSSIERQFEFVQQQWVNYGNDFKLANTKDPLIGNHDGTDDFMIPSDGPHRPPFFCARLPRFVTTRGGEYFFIPSLTAIRMMADHQIDPT